ncbi:MAG: PilN domain-containing protein [bacterium]
MKFNLYNAKQFNCLIKFFFIGIISIALMAIIGKYLYALYEVNIIKENIKQRKEVISRLYNDYEMYLRMKEETVLSKQKNIIKTTPSQVVDDLGYVFSTNVIISEIKIINNTIEILGYSYSVEELKETLDTLEQSSYFKAVDVTYVNQQVEDQYVRFYYKIIAKIPNFIRIDE